MFAGRFGMERSLAVAMPLFVVYFLMLASMPKWPWLFFGSWIVLTLFKMFFWPAYHGEISKFGDKKNRGTEISWLFAINRGAGVLGPMIGGIVITVFGFPVLFVIAAGLALLASFPLLRTKERFRPMRMNYFEPWKILNRHSEMRVRWGMMGWVSHLVSTVYWPILMFFTLGAANIIGFIASANVLVMTMLGFVVGEVSDRMSRQKVLRLHLPFMVLGFLLRPLATTPLRVLLTDTLAKASFIGVHLPMWYRLYKRAERIGPLKYVTALEMILCVYKALGAMALIFVFSMTTPYVGLSIAFIIGAFFVSFFAFI